MEIIFGLQNIGKIYPHPVITIGTFDGMHHGHQKIISQVVKRAKNISGTSIVLTFNPHPQEILTPAKAPLLLTTLDEKINLFKELKVDLLLIINFTQHLSKLSPADFVKGILHNQLKSEEVFIGYNYTFGFKREGDFHLLEQLGKVYGFKVKVVSPIKVKKRAVSSTLIREKILAGKVKEAGTYLGHFPSLSGRVISGDKRGKSLGYPTSNLSIEENKLLPPAGVYAVYIKLDKKVHKGVLNIGFRPTFKGKRKSVEVHIFNFKEKIYGKCLQIALVKRLREEKAFARVEDLICQIGKDIKRARRILSRL